MRFTQALNQARLVSGALFGRVSQTIRNTIKKWTAEQPGLTPYKINDGLCDDFAATVIISAAGGWENFQAMLEKGSPELLKVDVDVFTEDGRGLVWDPQVLAKYGMRVPEAFQPDQAEYHVWVMAEEGGKYRHFDAEAPDGVDSFAELPFFQHDWSSTTEEYQSHDEESL